MPYYNEVDHINTLITKHRRRLQSLKEKQADLGINAPPEILNEIEDIEEEIEELQGWLGWRGVSKTSPNVENQLKGIERKMVL